MYNHAALNRHGNFRSQRLRPHEFQNLITKTLLARYSHGYASVLIGKYTMFGWLSGNSQPQRIRSTSFVAKLHKKVRSLLEFPRASPLTGKTCTAHNTAIFSQWFRPRDFEIRLPTKRSCRLLEKDPFEEHVAVVRLQAWYWKQGTRVWMTKRVEMHVFSIRVVLRLLWIYIRAAYNTTFFDCNEGTKSTAGG